MSQETKRAGRALYTPFEKNLLQKLISKPERVKVISCKETNKAASLKKQAVFAAVANEFNASFNITTKRTVKQIKEWHKATKRLAKLAAATGSTPVCAATGFRDLVTELKVVAVPPVCAATGFRDLVTELQVVAVPLLTPSDSDALLSEKLIPENAGKTEVILPDMPSLSKPFSLCNDVSNNVKLNTDTREDCLDSTRCNDVSNDVEFNTDTRENYLDPTRVLGDKPLVELGEASSPSSKNPNTLCQEKVKPPISSSLELLATSVSSAASKVAAAIEKEKSFKIKMLRNEENRNLEQHSIKMELLRIQLKVQQKLFELLETNPSPLNIVIK